MQGQQQDVLFVCQLQQLAANKWSLREIEESLRFELDKLVNPMGMQGWIKLAQVVAGQGKTDVSGFNVLVRLPLNQYKASAQAFMAGNQTIKGNSQGMMIK
ncbi:hypothetical protein Xets_02157 [Xenorhabdus sp. TS4]|uniref:Uncharacterized protein n=1 Tax=Xenorhabdus ehlersii TaxID=290111 RepID=A0A2D0IL34_9GAMM|nr:hypothetical protein [Xenorhabdus sp. TS4]PHM22408.1 hypothetical protein Xehl_03697 [Xenorhabdus ehlersii]